MHRVIETMIRRMGRNVKWKQIFKLKHAMCILYIYNFCVVDLNISNNEI